jgi:hypothetical protein
MNCQLLKMTHFTFLFEFIARSKVDKGIWLAQRLTRNLCIVFSSEEDNRVRQSYRCLLYCLGGRWIEVKLFC